MTGGDERETSPKSGLASYGVRSGSPLETHNHQHFLDWMLGQAELARGFLASRGLNVSDERMPGALSEEAEECFGLNSWEHNAALVVDNADVVRFWLKFMQGRGDEFFGMAHDVATFAAQCGFFLERAFWQFVPEPETGQTPEELALARRVQRRGQAESREARNAKTAAAARAWEAEAQAIAADIWARNPAPSADAIAPKVREELARRGIVNAKGRTPGTSRIRKAIAAVKPRRAKVGRPV